MNAKPKSRKTSAASPSRGFERELDEIAALGDRLRNSPSPEATDVEQLRRVLGNRNNFVVSKAAKLVAEHQVAALLPDVLAAYERFFVDAVKNDPQCWAKNELAKALVKLEHRSKDAYVRGLQHHQLEPVWGGESDTAGTLRGVCALALVDCPGISDAELLALLLEPLTDPDKSVRIEGARAIASVGGVSAGLLLRLRVLLAGSEKEPEVMGAVFSSLLSLEGGAAIPMIAKALEGEDDFASEAAFALASLRSVEAFHALRGSFENSADTWFRGVVLSAIATTRLQEAFDFLIGMIARNSRGAEDAIESMLQIFTAEEQAQRIEQAVQQSESSTLERAYRKARAAG